MNEIINSGLHKLLLRMFKVAKIVWIDWFMILLICIEVKNFLFSFISVAFLFNFRFTLRLYILINFSWIWIKSRFIFYGFRFFLEFIFQHWCWRRLSTLLHRHQSEQLTLRIIYPSCLFLLESYQKEWIVHKHALLKKLLILIQPLLEIFPLRERHLDYIICVSQKVKVLPNSPIVLDFSCVSSVQWALKIIDACNLLDLIAHEVVHDDHGDGLHEFYLNCVDAVEASQHWVLVVTNMLVILVKDTLSYQKLKFILLQGLDNKLAIGGVKEEAIWFSRSNLEFRHLRMVFSRSKRFQKEFIVVSWFLPDLRNDISFKFLNLDLNSLTLG